ncbi:MAG: UvrD-helicase domain-containing protein [Phycisphaerales bacterium]
MNAVASLPRLRHRRILASAGTGKTWQLTTQYLALLLRTPECRPESILATTFTRKAAGEIKDRVLARLAIASMPDGSESSAERASIARALGVSPSTVTAAACAAALARVVRGLDRVQIRTLDSFFMAIAVGSSHELRIPIAARPLTQFESSRVENAAISRVVSALADREIERLFELLDDVDESAMARDVDGRIHELCASIADGRRSRRRGMAVGVAAASIGCDRSASNRVGA